MLDIIIDLIKSEDKTLPFNIVFGLLLISTATIIFTKILKKINPSLTNSRIIWILTLLGIPVFVLSGENILSRIASSIGLNIESFLNTLRNIILWISAGSLTVNAIKVFIWDSISRKTGNQVPQILINFISGIIYILTIYFIMTFVFELKVTGLVVSSGIIAGVIGLSMQNILSDLIAGIALAIEKPYRIGDWIEFKDGTLGEVTDINWRTTRLLSWKDSIYVVPNGKAMEATVHNYNLPNNRYKNTFNVSLSPDISPEDAKRILLESALGCDKIIKDPPPFVRLIDIEKKPYKYMIVAYYTDYFTYYSGRDQLMMNIWSNFRKFGIESSPEVTEINFSEKEKKNLKVPKIDELISGAELFNSLDSKEIEKLSLNSEIHLYRAGDFLMHQGDEGNDLYLITAGVVSVSARADDGETVELARFGVGDTFGENSFLTGDPRSSNVIALTDCQAIEIGKNAFEEILKNRPELVEELARIMAERRIHREQKLSAIHRKSTSELLSTYAFEMLNKMKDFFRI